MVATLTFIVGCIAGYCAFYLSKDYELEHAKNAIKESKNSLEKIKMRDRFITQLKRELDVYKASAIEIREEAQRWQHRYGEELQNRVRIEKEFKAYKASNHQGGLEVHKDAIIHQFKMGLKIVEIAKQYQVSSSAIFYALKRWGYK